VPVAPRGSELCFHTAFHVGFGRMATSLDMTG
jgi:hypothetical protein